MDVIVDVDGTIANLDHRRPLVEKPGLGPADTPPAVPFKPNWPRFHDRAHLDTPIIPVIELVRALWTAGHRVIITTGRPATHRDLLEVWLDTWGVQYTLIYMRADKDYRQDSIVKAEMLERMVRDGYTPQLAIDDRQQVVDMWRRAGLICLQAAPGDF